MKELAEILAAFHRPEIFPAALATLVQVNGSSYRRAGARLLLGADGTRHGSISGGCLEDDVITRAREVMRSGVPQVALYDTTSENDLIWGVGLGCHGVVRILIEALPAAPDWAAPVEACWRKREAAHLAVRFSLEPAASAGTRLQLGNSPVAAQCDLFVQVLPPPLSLLVFGAGDDAKPLVRFSAELGWHAVVIDPRPHYATRHASPKRAAWSAAPRATFSRTCRSTIAPRR